MAAARFDPEIMMVSYGTLRLLWFFVIGDSPYNHIILGGDEFGLGVEEYQDVPAQDKSIRITDPNYERVGKGAGSRL